MITRKNVLIAKLMLVTCIYQSALLSDDGLGWNFAKKRAENAVVQIWSQITEINWLTPFSTPTQGQAAGSGFFISTEGYILTNYHVVAGARSVFVNIPKLANYPLDAEIIGVCPDLDIALLKLTEDAKATLIEACGSINALEFGDSDGMEAPQRLLLLGYPLATRAILKHNTGDIAGSEFVEGRSLIQINNPSNGGNSGGPCLDSQGKVIGMLVSGRQNAQNYNYCIPINDILIVLPDLYNTKLIRRPEFGIGTNRSTDFHAKSLLNPVPGGVYVNRVLENSMEERAGIKVGDMIYEVEFNGSRYQVDQYGKVHAPWRPHQKISVEELLVRCRVGDPIAVVVYRNGMRLEFNSVFENPQLYPLRYIFAEYEPEEIDYEIVGGAVIMQLRENHLNILLNNPHLKHLQEIREYNRPENQAKAALVITTIFVGSQAHLCECLSTGFILNKVNGQKVTTLKELREALMLSANTKQIAIETKDKPCTVLSLDKVLDDEPRLARDFMYPVTDTIKKLRQSTLQPKG